jgi:hypothetical protein
VSVTREFFAVNLPKPSSVHHPAAFFHVDSRQQKTDFYKSLVTYPEIVSVTGIISKLKRDEQDWKERIAKAGSW